MTRRVAVVLFVAAAAVIWYLSRDQLSLDRVIETESRLRGLIEAQPRLTFAIGFALYVLVSLVPGTTGKAAVAGWLFGFWPALLMVVGALTLAGVVGFWVARYLLHDPLRRAFGLRLTRFDRDVVRDGAFYLLTLRLLHVPFTLVNYLSGVSDIRARTFVWTTAVGLVPGTVVLVGLGAGLPSLDRLSTEGVISLLDPVTLTALLAMGLVPWSVRAILHKLRGTPVPDGGRASATGGTE